ncbi:MAG: helix-turn-helix domain-containing protein [Ferribacterium limneticum]
MALFMGGTSCETLFQLSINHPWRDARLRASGLLMLSKGEHPNAIGQQCGVSQTIYNWRHAWEQTGFVGLISGHAGGTEVALRIRGDSGLEKQKPPKIRAVFHLQTDY